MKLANFIVLTVIVLAGCGLEPPSPWERKVLRVAVVATAPGVGASPTHFERELARRFADSIGLSVDFVERPAPSGVIAALRDGAADLAIIGTTVQHGATGLVSGRRYRWVEHLVIRRYKGVSPKTARDLVGQEIVVPKDSGVARTLGGLRERIPELTWVEAPEKSTAALIAAVWQKDIALTVATSDHLSTFRHYYPEIRPSLSLARSKPIAWAFPSDRNAKLYLASIYFLNRLERSHALDRLTEEHFGHLRDFDYVETRRMLKQVRDRLPDFIRAFQSAAQYEGLDWRLLAAIGYRESNWDPKAVSPTGVRGIMMLAQLTARELGVDRNDPAESIAGAAKYLAELARRLPSSIPAPDRSWFTLASYNAGLRRVLGARRLAYDAGQDPDRWATVREFLPLLQDPSWYSRKRHGAGRGVEAVRFVNGVRRSYEVLKHRYRDEGAGL